jgi:hypothetical protein
MSNVLYRRIIQTYDSITLTLKKEPESYSITSVIEAVCFTFIQTPPTPTLFSRHFNPEEGGSKILPHSVSFYHFGMVLYRVDSNIISPLCSVAFLKTHKMINITLSAHLNVHTFSCFCRRSVAHCVNLTAGKGREFSLYTNRSALAPNIHPFSSAYRGLFKGKGVKWPEHDYNLTF